MRLAVAVLVQNASGDVLFTRRCQTMRSFPCAWVFPGGGLETGESLQQCAQREVKEETGLDIDGLRWLGCWESCYPTSAEECNKLGRLQGHYLVLVMRAQARPPQRLTLQVDETDMAVWAPLEVLKDLVNHPSPDSHMTEKRLPVVQTSSATTEEVDASRRLRGIYPNHVREGITQGYLFVLHELFNTSVGSQ
jgi:8-oxo-dGTP pyrophosphatase MutT (NUDIX family)